MYLLALFPTPEFPVYNSDDGSYFVTLALNLLDHSRYSVDTWPGTVYGHHATWPPLHPLLLAAVIATAGHSWAAIKVVMAVLGLLGLYLWFRLFRTEPGGPAAILALSLSPTYFIFAHHPMAEVPFMALCAAVLLALRTADSSMRAFGAGLLAAAAFMVRGYGVAFLPAALIWFATRTGVSARRRLLLAGAFVAPLVLTIVGWQQFTSHVMGSMPLDSITAQYGNGTKLFAALIQSPIQHLKNLYWFELRYPAHFVFPFIPLGSVLSSPVPFFLAIPTLGLMGIGWFERVRGGASPGDIWVPCLGLLTYLMSVNSHGVRYWLTLLPFGFLYLFNGIRVVGRPARLPKIAHFGEAAVLLALAAGLAVHFAEPDRLRFASSHWREYRDIAAWAAINLPADAAVVAHAPHKFYAVTRRATYPADRPESIGLASGHREAYVLCGEDSHVPQSHRDWCATALSLPGVVLRTPGLALARLK